MCVCLSYSAFSRVSSLNIFLLQIVNTLLKGGADVNSPGSSKDGATPLYYAAGLGFSEVRVYPNTEHKNIGMIKRRRQRQKEREREKERVSACGSKRE